MRTISARWFHKGRIAPIRLVVIHDMEISERPTTAEDCARMFATTPRQASAHVCVDNNSVVRCVADKNTAWAAPGANADGLQMELAGFARQTRAEWLDAYGKDLLEQAAAVAAAWCTQYGIPIRKLTRAELAAGKKGFTSHADVSAVYKRSDHSDPGKDFPWDVFLELVRDAVNGDDDGDDQAEVPEFTATLKVGSSGDPVRVWQRRMRALGWDLTVDGIYGPKSQAACRNLQTKTGVPVTGVVDEETWLLTFIWEPGRE